LARTVDPARTAAASPELPIVVEGETGCGKECVARAIHEWSQRRGEFVGVNCAALPEHLAEAELFGYRKGAFTGADRSSPDTCAPRTGARCCSTRLRTSPSACNRSF